MTGAYVLTAAAEADLREIVRYTQGQWGEAQVRRYMTRLDRGIVRLAAGHSPSKDMSELYPMLRMARCERHYVFYLPRPDEPALIVAVFHERMDLMIRVADRLG